MCEVNALGVRERYYADLARRERPGLTTEGGAGAADDRETRTMRTGRGEGETLRA